MPDLADARIAFAGTPEFARIILQALLDADIRPVLVLTQPDRARGRGRKLSGSPVKALASEYSLLVDQPIRLKGDEQIGPLAAAAPDVLIVAAYGIILPPRVLSIPRRGCVNVPVDLAAYLYDWAPLGTLVWVHD